MNQVAKFSSTHADAAHDLLDRFEHQLGLPNSRGIDDKDQERRRREQVIFNDFLFAYNNQCMLCSGNVDLVKDFTSLSRHSGGGGSGKKIVGGNTKVEAGVGKSCNQSMEEQSDRASIRQMAG